MLSPTEIGDRVALMVEARAAGNDALLVDMVNQAVSGPRGDALNLVLVLAGVLATDLGEDPEDGYHRFQGSAHDLPDYMATFMQMVVAVANGDRRIAKDLFMAYVGGDGHRALTLLILAINEVTHAN